MRRNFLLLLLLKIYFSAQFKRTFVGKVMSLLFNMLSIYFYVPKRPWCWERLKSEGEGDDRGWDGWMASLTWWTRVWASSGSWWWTGKPAVLQSTGLQSRTWLSDWTDWLTMWQALLQELRTQRWTNKMPGFCGSKCSEETDSQVNT